jgi:hypothetical protein
MTKPITHPVRQPLVHHPSDVLDLFGHFDATNRSWLEFDDNLSLQIEQFEDKNRRFIRVRPNFNRRTSR